MPVRDKAHQQRYVFNPTSAAALMVFERLGHDGGVQEILTLLDRTRTGLRSGVATVDQVRRALAQARRGFAVNADHLNRLVTSSPLGELLTERRHHRSGDALLGEAKELIALVVERFPGLAADGDRLIREAVRYSHAVQRFISRLLDEATTHRDFSMLDAEQYLTAALTATKEALAQAFGAVIFDPPNPPVDADGLIQAVEQLVPRSGAPTGSSAHRPPAGRGSCRPRSRAGGTCPAATHADGREGIGRRGLGGRYDHAAPGRLRSRGKIVAELLAAHADPGLPYSVELSEALIVDPPSEVTHVSPVTVHRGKGWNESHTAPGSRPRATSVWTNGSDETETPS